MLLNIFIVFNCRISQLLRLSGELAECNLSVHDQQDMVRTATFALIGVTCLVGSPAGAAQGEAGKTYRRFRGQIVYQAKPFASFDSEATFMDLVRKASKQKQLTRSAKGNWTLHFLAFLRSAPKHKRVNLVWYRLGKRRPEQVDFTAFTMSPRERTLRGQVTVTADQGFAPNQTYELRLTRLVRGREKVYARCRITLI